MSKQAQGVSYSEGWPPLPFAEWQDTYATLHMWTQIVGKVRLAQAPMLNHWWQVPLYVTARGLTTSAIPYGDVSFEISFDFLDHQLRLQTSNGAVRTLALAPRSVADFYGEFMAAQRALGLEVKIWTMPVEVQDPIPFDEDDQHHTYVPEHAQRFWRVLKQADRVLQQFRCGFLGKCSPVHFFWGSFDLAVTRFSGRPAPPHPGGVPHMADWVTRLAYSHEVSSCGFWPGGGPVPEAVFYAYAYPEPDGFRNYPVRPQAAYYSDAMREFILPYEAVRRAADPDATLIEFAQSTYEAAAVQGGWDRPALEYVALENRSGEAIRSGA
jgi:hypothetical protein